VANGFDKNIRKSRKQKQLSENKFKLKAMKTTKQIRKTGTFVIAFALAIFSTNAQSHDFLKQLPSAPVASAIQFKTNSKAPGHMKIASPAKNDLKPTAETNENGRNLSFDAESESALQIETWMISNKYFTCGKPEIDTEKDKQLEIEDWMTNNQFWAF